MHHRVMIGKEFYWAPLPVADAVGAHFAGATDDAVLPRLVVLLVLVRSDSCCFPSPAPVTTSAMTSFFAVFVVAATDYNYECDYARDGDGYYIRCSTTKLSKTSTTTTNSTSTTTTTTTTNTTARLLLLLVLVLPQQQ